jgi:glycerol-3-phosphate dehydrogenase (NAD(P)+)
MKIAVLSDGAWATALALLLLGNKHNVTLWGPFPDHIEEMKRTRKNNRFFKGQSLPEQLKLTSQIAEAIEEAEIIVQAAPTQYARKCLESLVFLGDFSNKILVNVAKGIEIGSLKRISEICSELLGEINYCVLSGPSHAEEVVNGVPTAVVAASKSSAIANRVQNAFINDVFRVYTNDDVIGVEVGGALKNVFAIAAGSCDGMKLGDNSKAALITRGVAEMARLGQALGGRAETFSGLSGLGDMIVTCCSSHSRNRHVGEELGRGKPLDEIIRGMGMVVAEGVTTTESAFLLAKSKQVETPIINEIYAGLYEGKDLRQGLRDLMTRKAKSELD